MIKSQFYLLFKRKEFKISLLIMTLVSVGYFIFKCIYYFGYDITSVLSAKYLYIGSRYTGAISYFIELLIPFIVAIPFADSLFEERKRKTIQFCLSRTTITKYYFSKLLVVFVGGILIVLIQFLINIILNAITFPVDSSFTAHNLSIHNSYTFETLIKTILLKNFFAGNMNAYNCIYMVMFSVAGGLFSVITYQLSLFYKKSRIFLLMIFYGVYIFSQAATMALGYNEYHISTYLFSSDFYKNQTASGLIFSFAILILSALLPIPFAKRKLVDLYD